MKITWEYKTVQLETGGWVSPKVDHSRLELLLNDLGREGWELVGVVGTNDQGGKTRTIVGVLKRPLT
jgi:hypothetical protein